MDAEDAKKGATRVERLEEAYLASRSKGEVVDAHWMISCLVADVLVFAVIDACFGTRFELLGDNEGVSILFFIRYAFSFNYPLEDSCPIVCPAQCEARWTGSRFG